MEKTLDEKLAEMMTKQSGELVYPETVNKVTAYACCRDPQVYMALTTNYTCIAHVYQNGTIHVYVH